MHNPNDDPDVTSGTTDGAQMETTPAPTVAHTDSRHGGDAGGLLRVVAWLGLARTPAVRARQRGEPLCLPIRAGQAPLYASSDDVGKKMAPQPQPQSAR